MFPWGLWEQDYYQQVSEGVSDVYALACEHRETFSGRHKSILNSLYSQKQKNVVTCTMRKCPMQGARCTSCYVMYKGVCGLCWVNRATGPCKMRGIP